MNEKLDKELDKIVKRMFKGDGELGVDPHEAKVIAEVDGCSTNHPCIDKMHITDPVVAQSMCLFYEEDWQSTAERLAEFPKFVEAFYLIVLQKMAKVK